MSVDLASDAPSPTFKRRALRVARKAGRITIADVMAAAHMSMRESFELLSSLEADGALARSGGGTGTAIVWSPR